MGVFFTNYLVDAPVDRVRAALERLLVEDGWQLAVPEASDAPRRRIALVPSDRWVAVYDQGTETQDQKAWSDGAVALSAATGAAVAATLVHDSDILDVRVFDGGELVCFLYQAPGDRGFNEGGLGSWRRVFPDLDATQFGKVLVADPVFVENTLHALATALGLPDTVMTGFQYAAEQGFPGSAIVLECAPKDEDVPAIPAIQGVHAAKITLGPGESKTWTVTYRNHGAAAAGLRVRITGTALAAGLIAIDHVDIEAGYRSYRESGAREDDALVAAFPQAAVPVGSSPERLAQLKRIGWGAWMHAAMPCLVEVKLAIRGAASGSGTLVVALEAANGGDPAEHMVECVVEEKPRSCASDDELDDIMQRAFPMSGSRWELCLVRRGDTGWTEGPIVRADNIVSLVLRLIVYEAAPVDGVIRIESIIEERVALSWIDDLPIACSRLEAYLHAVRDGVARVRYDTPAEWFDASMLADPLVQEADFANRLLGRGTVFA